MISNDRDAIRIPVRTLTDDPWRLLGLSLGAGRVALGAAFWFDPVHSVRVAGMAKTAAPGVDWLARMTAARDVAIGAGTTLSVLRTATPGIERAAWYGAGALADLGDAVSILRGSREGRLARLPGRLMALAAFGTAVVGAVAAGHDMAVPRP